MPNAPLRLCSYPGCNSLVKIGRCPAHAPKKQSYSKLYHTARWRRSSRHFLDRRPLCECEDCRAAGLIMAATVVDHIIPHRGDDSLFWSEKNWRPMSATCHNRKSGRESGEEREYRRSQEG